MLQDPNPGPDLRVLQSRTRVARKPHSCGICRKPIAQGSRYLYEFVLFEGAPESWRYHPNCRFDHGDSDADMEN